MNNRFINNAEYGLAAFESTNSTAINNLADGNGEAGLYFGDSPNATIAVRKNVAINNNGSGICLRDSRSGFVSYNTVTGNCVGILVLADKSRPRWRLPPLQQQRLRQQPGLPGE